MAGACGCRIDVSFAEGDVNVTGNSGSYIGGLVGAMDHGELHNSYASGKVNAPLSNLVGGLVGYIRNSINSSYSMGDVITNGTLYGGVVGNAFIQSTVRNNYYSGHVSGGNNVGIKRTEQQLKDINQLQLFSIVKSSSMTNPWLIVPGRLHLFRVMVTLSNLFFN